MTTTATRMMAAISNQVRTPGPEVSADQLARLTSPACRLPFLSKVGILSFRRSSAIGNPRSNDVDGLMPAAVFNRSLDLADDLDEGGRRIERERARAREVDLEGARQAARARRHHEDAVGEEDGLGDVVGDEDDGLAGL